MVVFHSFKIIETRVIIIILSYTFEVTIIVQCTIE